MSQHTFKNYQLKTAKYFKKKTFIEQVNNSFLESIEEVCGGKKKESVKNSGLVNMHKYIDPSFLPFITYTLNNKIKNIVLKQVALIGLNNLKIKKNFYIDDNVVYRIHYPHSYAKKSFLKRKFYLALNLKNFKNAKNEISRVKNKKVFNLSSFDLAKIRYHRDLPNEAYAHGPHRDTWFGHTFGALNLWWSICGVNKDSGLIIFPKDNGFGLEHLSMPAYISPDQPISKPEIISLEDGKLYIFDPEILHATKLNTSNETRIVITGRINKEKPTFYKGTNEIEYMLWHKSNNLLNEKFSDIKKFPRKKNLVKKPILKAKNFDKRVKIFINKKFKKGINLYNNLKGINFSVPILIEFINKKLIILKKDNHFCSFSAACPHLGINLIDGFFDKDKVVCPGHGLSFNFKNGKSSCAKFSIKSYTVSIGEKKFLIS